MEEKQELNGAETLMGFLAWLTTREVSVTFGGHHECGIAVALFEEFNKHNNIGVLGPEWPNFTMPYEEGSFITNAEKPLFQKELGRLINHYSLENGSDTPDFMLAEYMITCLRTYEILIQKRDKWYGEKRWNDRIFIQHTEPAKGN